MGQLGKTSRFMSNTGQLSRLSRGATTQAVEKSGEIIATAGTTQLIVPPGVTRLSVVAIAAGQNGERVDYCCTCVCPPVPRVYYASGGSGSLGYSNFIPVIPGEALTVLVDSPSIGKVALSKIQRGNVVLISAGATARSNTPVVALSCIAQVTRRGAAQCCYATPAPGYGANAQQGAPPAAVPGGGGATSYTAAALVSAIGTALYGLGPDGVNAPGRYGGSIPSCTPRAALYGAGSRSSNAGVGGIRLIWGGSRGFPSNARKITT